MAEIVFEEMTEGNTVRAWSDGVVEIDGEDGAGPGGYTEVVGFENVDALIAVLIRARDATMRTKTPVGDTQ